MSLQLNTDISETELGDILSSGLSSSALTERLIYIFLIDSVKLEIAYIFLSLFGKFRTRSVALPLTQMSLGFNLISGFLLVSCDYLPFDHIFLTLIGFYFAILYEFL